MKQRGWTRVALLGAGLLILAWLVTHFGTSGIVSAFAAMDPRRFAVYFLLAASIRLTAAARWWLINVAMGVRLSWLRFVAARLSGDAVGGLLPATRLGGDPLRVLLVQRQGVSGAQAGAGVALDRFLEVTGNTLAVLAYLAIYSSARALPHGRAVEVLFVALLVALVVTGVLLRCGRKPFSPPLRFLTAAVPRLRSVADAVSSAEDDLTRFFRSEPRTLGVGLLLTVVIEVVAVFEYRALFSAFGLPTDVPTVVMVLLGGGLARAIPTPAGLGALEASGVAMLALVDGRPELGFVVGGLLRLDDLLWTAIGLATLAATGVPARRAAAASRAAS